MKKALIFSLTALLTFGAYADIQSPPMIDQGPTRKLGRGLGNIAFGVAEIPQSMCLINEQEGNSAAFSYGIVKGLGRTFARIGSGFYARPTGVPTGPVCQTSFLGSMAATLSSRPSSAGIPVFST
jgi:putative exosortase-associated protein (TIGR04073 family)